MRGSNQEVLGPVAYGAKDRCTPNSAVHVDDVADAHVRCLDPTVPGNQGYILSSGTAVMSIGGWSGTDDNVTLAQFQQYVANGQIHYFISGGQGGGPGGNSGSGSEITTWVKAHFKAITVNGATVYDLTQATS